MKRRTLSQRPIKNNRWDKFYDRFGVRGVLNAVRGQRVRNLVSPSGLK